MPTAPVDEQNSAPCLALPLAYRTCSTGRLHGCHSSSSACDRAIERNNWCPHDWSCWRCSRLDRLDRRRLHHGELRAVRLRRM